MFRVASERGAGNKTDGEACLIGSIKGHSARPGIYTRRILLLYLGALLLFHKTLLLFSLLFLCLMESKAQRCRKPEATIAGVYIHTGALVMRYTRPSRAYAPSKYESFQVTEVSSSNEKRHTARAAVDTAECSVSLQKTILFVSGVVGEEKKKRRKKKETNPTF